MDESFPPFLEVLLHRKLGNYGVDVGLRAPWAELATDSSPWRMQYPQLYLPLGLLASSIGQKARMSGLNAGE